MSEFETTRFTKRNYQGRAARYDSKRFSSGVQQFWHAHDIGILNELLGETEDVRLLEVACGTGRVSVSLSSPQRKIYGAELAADMLALAVEKSRENPQLGCTWLRANAVQLPFRDGTFDGLFAVRFLNLFSHADLKVVCAELERAVRKDGVLVVHFSNAFYGGCISMVRRLLGSYSKHLLWPGRIGKLFPHCRVEASRGTYLPFQKHLLPLLGEEKAAKVSRWISKSFLRHFTHTRFYRLVKQEG